MAPIGYTRRMNDSSLTLPAEPTPGPARAPTAAAFRGLAEVSPELEGFANRPNPRTRRAYPQDVRDLRACIKTNSLIYMTMDPASSRLLAD